ncbi:hypothetical protein C8F04DRAFT_623412 [Mycena alexandri]|uniref:Uncharacterized protein n=1 Tax=Mycena alexandri TaxID=1745969 RepID=A0AAD6SVC8_9AGAR|nr:hypothetical protein C8F04DRAFT_623412 [Mycena alexandri]
MESRRSTQTDTLLKYNDSLVRLLIREQRDLEKAGRPCPGLPPTQICSPIILVDIFKTISTHGQKQPTLDLRRPAVAFLRACTSQSACQRRRCHLPSSFAHLCPSTTRPVQGVFNPADPPLRLFWVDHS